MAEQNGFIENFFGQNLSFIAHLSYLLNLITGVYFILFTLLSLGLGGAFPSAAQAAFFVVSPFVLASAVGILKFTQRSYYGLNESQFNYLLYFLLVIISVFLVWVEILNPILAILLIVLFGIVIIDFSELNERQSDNLPYVLLICGIGLIVGISFGLLGAAVLLGLGGAYLLLNRNE